MAPPTSSLIEPLDSALLSPLTRQPTFFPPTQRVDFVVHFGHTDFHCHTFVLHLHSTYFRHLFDALAPSTSPLPPPPTLPPADARDVDVRSWSTAAAALSPTPSPTLRSSPVKHPMLTSSTQSAPVRLTVHPELVGTKRKRDAMDDECEDILAAHSTARLVCSAASSPSSTLTASTPSPCAHSGVRCVHIPAQRTLVSGEPISEADFDLFLRHLYFCAHYRFPPYLPVDDLSLTATSAPAITLPPYPQLTETVTSSLLRTHKALDSGVARQRLVWRESLLTLALYFDCQALLARCEAVGMRRLEHVRRAGAYFDILYAHQYSLQAWKRRCIELILTDRREQRKQHALTALWDKRLLCDILAAANERMRSGSAGKVESKQPARDELVRVLARVMARRRRRADSE